MMWRVEPFPMTARELSPPKAAMWMLSLSESNSFIDSPSTQKTTLRVAQIVLSPVGCAAIVTMGIPISFTESSPSSVLMYPISFPVEKITFSPFSEIKRCSISFSSSYG